MKKFSYPILVALLPLMASAYDAKVNGISYNFSGSEAEVTYSNNDGTSDYSGSVVIPESVTYNGKTYRVTSIANSAFGNCSGLTSVSIPESVTSIGNGAFQGCRALPSVVIPKGLKEIDQNVFMNCSSLKSVSIPEGVTSIGLAAFSGCRSLASVTIPNDVISIGNGAFYGCSSLTSITIPEGITSIGFSTFHNCSNLSSVTLPNSVTSIGGEAFMNCSSLNSITIPNRVTNIDNYAFDGCNSLTDVYCYATEPPSVQTRFEDEVWDGYPFDQYYIKEHTTLHVPAASVEKYKTALRWSDFANIVALPQEISKPMLKDGRVWNCIEVYMGEEKNDTVNREYRIEGTSEIDGHVCYNLCLEGKQIGSYYEEGPKVFHYTANGWELLFDFSLSPGDAVPNWGGLIVDEVKTNVIKGESRRCLYFPLTSTDGTELCWIEGIGSSLSGPFNYTAVIGSLLSVKLLSVYDDDVCVFEADDLTTKTEYRPFVEDNKQWVVVSADYRIHYTKIYYIEGDTIVCNQPCKKLMLRYKNYRDGTETTSLYCCIFEEDAKVFYFPTDAVLPASPIMLYDFKATVGDIISLGGLPDDSHKETYYQVWQDMQQEINGENFHALLATEYNPSITYADEESVLPLYKWYEGIGSRIHPFEKRFWNRKMGGKGEFLYECRVKDRIIYSDSNGVVWEPVTFTQDQMATIILPTAPDASKGKYYRLDRCEDGQIIFEQELQPRAHVPYIIVPSEDFSIDPRAFDLSGLNSDTVSIDGISFIGSYVRKELPALTGGDGGGSLYYDIIDTTPDCSLSPWGETEKGAIIGALRAYLLVSWSDPYNPGGTRGPNDKMGILLKDDPNGMIEIQNSTGKWSNGKCYDLSGRKIVNRKSSNRTPLAPEHQLERKKSPRGIYIIDGKKKVSR